MSAEMRSFMEAYGAVHSKEVKENLDNSRDSISEMNLSKMTESDLCEAVEEVLEVWFAEGHTVAECEAIVESILVPSQIPGRQGKIERLLEAFGAVIGRVKEKSARTAVESFALYRKGKQVKESWSNKFSHENGNERLHERLVAADFAKVKNGLLELYKGKHGQSEKEYADSRSPGGKMVSGDSKQSGAEYTHGRRVKAENPGMQPDVGGKTKPKSQGRMDAGTRADLQYRKANLKKEDFAGNYEGPLYAPHPDLAENKKEMLDQMNRSREGFMAQDGPNKPAYDAKQRIAAKTAKAKEKLKREEVEYVDEEKKKLPYLKMFRKAGNLGRDGSPEAMERSKKITKVMNDDAKRRAEHRERDDAAKEAKRMKKEELEFSQIRKDWAAAYKSIYEAAKPDYLDFDKDGDKEESMKKALKDKEGKCKKCGKEPCECPKEDVKEAKEKWIGSAIKKPGALHKQLGVPEGEPIPEAKLRAAAKQGGKLGQRARLALTLKGLNKEETDWEFLDNLIESEKFTEQQIQKIAEDL